MAASAQGNKLLIALDKSAGSDFALDWTLKTLHKPADTLFVLHVKKAGEDATKDMEEIKAKLDAKVKAWGIKAASVNFIVKDSTDPKTVVLSQAKDLAVSTIIVSSRSLGIVTGLLLGSVSKFVASNATVPVLIIKPPPTVSTSTALSASKLLNLDNMSALQDLVTYKP
eukprot:TRINITY_DN383_c0_g1_i1.p1 TRINITY_DN383_c0_g1~~TRINITY_DN383_c0_g1_i1.p1  ORF type:complete len:169 (+),score=38.36 TRINITY_DN383_c0_g1_i1:249-755(+)